MLTLIRRYPSQGQPKGPAVIPEESTQEIPTSSGLIASAEAVNGTWWAAGQAAHRPTSGTIPAVQTSRSFARSAVMPGLVMICGAVVMVASTMPWVTANLGVHMSYVSGTDKAVATAFGINGWTTFAAAAAFAVLGAVLIVTDERGVRFLAGLVGAGTLALALYELIRVLQQIHYARQTATRLYPSLSQALLGRVHVGYGLVLLVAAAGVGFLAALLSGAPD